MNGMTLKIDSAGRIVVPRQLRERYGIRAGMDLEVGEGEDCLTLRPVRQEPSMIRVNGFWVHQGVVPGGFDWNRHIDEERELRARQASGA